MPIRINLLAEAKELEDLRRRDPVKRVILAGAALVVVMLVWSSSFLTQTIIASGEVGRLERNLSALTNEYRQIIQTQATLAEAERKMAALHRLSTERFLVGNLLDAIQKTPLSNVQLVHLKLDHNYTITEEIKPKKAEHILPKAGASTEKIVLSLSAKDKSENPGDGVGIFQKTLSAQPYFESMLGKTNGFRLGAVGSLEKDPDGRPYVLMTLEARFPEKTR